MVVAEARQVHRRFGAGPGAVHPLRGVDLVLRRGQVVAIRGRSGSGKTTLLNLLGGLDRPSGGEIWLLGCPISQLPEVERTRLRRQQVGFVFQSFALMPAYSALENVELVLQIARVAPAERRRRATEWLEYVGLGPRLHHRPYELSGGEQQRVAVARALAAGPALVLADEPTGNLDTATGERVLALLRRIAREHDTAICITSHDPTIHEWVDQVYTLQAGRLEGEQA